ncbi:MAG: BTAD domain-containing putative transcriptional regulator, partial [Gemmatimonadales bacterium]
MPLTPQTGVRNGVKALTVKQLPNTPLIFLTLGPPRLVGSDSSLSSRRKDLALLAYVHRRSPRGVSRLELADLLWGERDEGRGRQSLRQALLELKRAVGDGLESEGELVRLQPRAVTLDAEEFERDVAAGRLQSAVDRWSGDFLAGLDDAGGEAFRAWLEAERESLRRRLAGALDSLMSLALAGGRKAEWVAWGERWVAALPSDELGHRRLIEALDASGRTLDARDRFLACVAILRTDLGVAPGAELRALGARLDREVAAAPRHAPGSAALFSPDLVGRGPALAELAAAWAAARAGRRTVVLLEGETGIGKTRLIEEFLRTIPGGEATILRPLPVESSALDNDLVHQLVTSLAAAPGFAATAPEAMAQLAEAAPTLRERYSGLPEVTPDGLADGRVLALAFGAVAGERAVLAAFDDFDAASPRARATLAAAAVRMEGPVLLVFAIAGDGDEAPRELAALKAAPGVRRIKLRPLAGDEIEALVSSMLVLPSDARRALSARLHAETGGNPLYAVELLGALVDEGVLAVGADGAWRVRGDDEWTARLPTGLVEIIGRRVARLEGDARQVAEVLAVLGNDADEALQRAVSGLDPPRFDAAMGELITSRLVREQQRSPGAYGFGHLLMRRTVYEGLPLARREEAHRAAVGSLRRRAPDDPARRSALARHLRLSGLDRSRKWWRSPPAAAALLFVIAGAVLAASAVSESRWALLRTLLTRSRPTLSARRVVVAPLENRTGDSSLTAFGDLSADWVAQGLMRTGEFEVVDPRTAAVAAHIVDRIPRLLRPGDRAIALAEETGAASVIGGAYYREGDSIRVVVRVTETATGRLLRTLAPISGPATALSRLVDSLRRRAVAALASASDTVSVGLAAGLGEAPSYEAYVETSHAWESFYRGDTADVFRRINRAVLSDPTYMPPLLMRAYVYTRYVDWPAADSTLAPVRSRRPLLTPTEAAILDIIEADIAGDLPGRLAAARALTRLAPASTEGFTLAADVALRLNHPREAMELLGKVDPERGLLLIAPYYWYTATQALHSLGDRDREIEAARRSIRQFPSDGSLRYRLVAALAASGNAEAAVAAARELIPGDPFPAQSAAMMGMVAGLELRAHGKPAAGTGILDSLAALPLPAAPDSASALFVRRLRGELLYALGRWRESERVLLPLRARLPDELGLTGRLATLAARLDRPEEAARASTELAARPAKYLHGRQTFWRAHIAASLGERDRAVSLLRQAYSEGYPVSDDFDLQP